MGLTQGKIQVVGKLVNRIAIPVNTEFAMPIRGPDRTAGASGFRGTPAPFYESLKVPTNAAHVTNIREAVPTIPCQKA